jgi:glycosyltransferase involved in cell wall biosynthesis
MRVDIVLTNLELSGSLKYMGALAEGFSELGHTVRFLYSGVGSDFSLVETVLGTHERIPYTRSWTQWASRALLGSPLLRIFGRGTFNANQSINVLGSLLSVKRFEQITRQTDVIVYVNALAYPTTLLMRQRQTREVVIFHEGIGADFLPVILRRLHQTYLREVARRVDLRVATTSKNSGRLRAQGIDSDPIYHGFFGGGLSPSTKERLVLTDSRWVKERDPLRIVSLADRLPKVPIVMVGRFADPELRDKLERLVRARGLEGRIRLSRPLMEGEIADLYRRARVVLRWAAPGTEDGFSWSLVNAVSAGCVPVMSEGLGGSRHLAEEVSPDLVQDSEEGLADMAHRLLVDDDYFSMMQGRVIAWRDRRQWRVVAKAMLDRIPAGRRGVESSY